MVEKGHQRSPSWRRIEQDWVAVKDLRLSYHNEEI